MPIALVTGGNGFIGRELCSVLHRTGWIVLALSRSPFTPIHGAITPLFGDITDKAFLSQMEVSYSFDAIFHLAAVQPGQCSDYKLLEINAAGTANLLEVYERSRASVFVYASSLPVIGKPVETPIKETHPAKPETLYHLSKYLGEIAALAYSRLAKRRVVALRITSPYGPGMPENRVFHKFLNAALECESIFLMGSGTRMQNFVHVSDVARACVQALRHGDGCYNLGGPESISMLEFARLALACAGESMRDVGFSGTPDPQEGWDWRVDRTLASEHLHYTPEISLRQGCLSYLAYLKNKRASSKK